MKMTLLGAGVRVPFVLRGLAATQEDLDLDEVVLHDVDGERLELMAALGASFCQEWGARFTVRGELDARAAIEGARFVFAADPPRGRSGHGRLTRRCRSSTACWGRRRPDRAGSRWHFERSPR